jgi:hypothetical protein
MSSSIQRGEKLSMRYLIRLGMSFGKVSNNQSVPMFDHFIEEEILPVNLHIPHNC